MSGVPQEVDGHARGEAEEVVGELRRVDAARVSRYSQPMPTAESLIQSTR